MILAARSAAAHGFAGKRFFPATLATDDPFVADELSLPTISTRRTSAEGGKLTRETALAVELSKRLTPSFALSAGDEFRILRPSGERSKSGFGNLEVGARYRYLQLDEHETVLSADLGLEIGSTGSAKVDADPFSTVTPALLFGQGGGDLPEALRFLRPLALTGVVGLAIPTSASTAVARSDGAGPALERHPDVLKWGLALEYSFIYLQSRVKDVGLRGPFGRFIPLVELALETPLDRGQGGETTGTIDPGIVWSGQHFQLGLETVLPLNSSSGTGVGLVGQLHFYLDDLFPRSIGRPWLEGDGR